jgi:hypothetical protein
VAFGETTQKIWKNAIRASIKFQAGDVKLKITHKS